jgi:hypothetical protein
MRLFVLGESTQLSCIHRILDVLSQRLTCDSIMSLGFDSDARRREELFKNDKKDSVIIIPCTELSTNLPTSIECSDTTAQWCIQESFARKYLPQIASLLSSVSSERPCDMWFILAWHQPVHVIKI